MTDLHIIGGGPCGSIAAIKAVRLGKNVLLSEEHKTAGGKPCSGLLSLQGLKTLEKYFSWKESVENELYGADIYFNNEVISVERKTPVAAVCNRDAFDRLCIRAAENEGARVEYGKRIVGLYRSKSVIGADGANSATANVFGFPPIKKFVCTMQGEAKAGWDEKKVSVFLSSEYPGFLGWVLPRGAKRFEIGCGVKLPNNPKTAFENLEKRLGVKATNKKAFIIPVKPRSTAAKKCAGYDVRLVGDAAGQAKPTTGGGILFGAWCAELAASAATPLGYEIGWRKQYFTELFFHGTIRNLLDSMDDKKLENFAKRIKKRDIKTFLENECDMEHASKVFVLAIKKPAVLLDLFCSYIKP